MYYAAVWPLNLVLSITKGLARFLLASNDFSCFAQVFFLFKDQDFGVILQPLEHAVLFLNAHGCT